MKNRMHRILLVLLGSLTCFAGVLRADLPEVTYPEADFKKLDTFEAHQLNQADKTFSTAENAARHRQNKKAYDNYELAAKQYDQFILEFPRSAAIPYALLRKGRCLQLANKRFKAVEEYEEVLLYFPNQVRYAAAALYYQGDCHAKNGDIEKALVTWAKMAEDVDYRKHYLAGAAFNALADNMWNQKRAAEAVKYYRMVVADFRGKVERRDMRRCIERVTTYFVRWNPDVEELASFYVEAKGFSDHRTLNDKDIPAKPLEDGRFWSRTINLIDDNGKFDEFHQSERRNYYKYWSDTMAGRFPGWDDFQLSQARYDYYVHGKKERWFDRIDQVYANGLNEENKVGRTIKWVDLYGTIDANKAREYVAKLDIAKINGKQAYSLVKVLVRRNLKDAAKEIYPWVNVEDLDWKERRDMIKMLYHELKDRNMAHNFFAKLKVREADDAEKERLAQAIYHYDEELVMKCYELMENRDRAAFLRLKYYHSKEKVAKGIEAADPVVRIAQYASTAWWYKAELHHWGKQWDEAIAAYRQAAEKHAPEAYFRIAECYMGKGNLAAAVNQLKEIENFIGRENARVASRAAYQVAVYYKRAKKNAEEIGALRHVMKKFPKSRESSHAHERLEALGVPIGGAVEEARN